MSSSEEPKKVENVGEKTMDKTTKGKNHCDSAGPTDGSSRPLSLNVDVNKITVGKNKSKNKKKNEAKRKSGNKKQDKTSEKQNQEESQSPSTPSSPPAKSKDSDPAPTPNNQATDISSPNLNAHDNATTTNVVGAAKTNDQLHKTRKKQSDTAKIRELMEQISNYKNQMQTLVDELKQHKDKTKDMESSLITSTKACNQLQRLLNQELNQKISLEKKLQILDQTVSRLKSQVVVHEKNKYKNDELIRVLNATLMERETENSLLKLKLTRLQTNPSMSVCINSSLSSIKQASDPCQSFVANGRSNSEFDRSSYIRSTIRAESTSSTRGSTSQLRSCDKDSLVWACLPEELTPSKRPKMLDESFNNLFLSSPITRDRRYRTLPKSMKSPSGEFKEFTPNDNSKANKPLEPKLDVNNCHVTNLDDSNSTTQSTSNKTFDPSNGTIDTPATKQPSNDAIDVVPPIKPEGKKGSSNIIVDTNPHSSDKMVKKSKIIKIFDKFRSPESPISTHDSTPFKRNQNRSTMSHMSPIRTNNFQTDKPFAEWDTNMVADWLNVIGLSMYVSSCRRWVRSGAHIMNSTPAEVDKGLGITNHLHRKKLRLAISDQNGDCDKITKAAAKLDYLWVSRWLDDLGLPQYKEAFINARVDGRVLNYLTVEDLLSMGVKIRLHHRSISCGIRVLKTIKFDLQLLKRRATSDEVEQMNSIRQQMDEPLSFKKTSSSNLANNEVALWTVTRVMEWLRMIDFAEYAPNLRGSGVHGGLIMLEDSFNFETLCEILTIQPSRTLLRRHLCKFFSQLVSDELVDKKRQYLNSNSQLNPMAEIKSPKKSPWFSIKLKPKGQDVTLEEYLCQDSEETTRLPYLAKIPESVNV